MSTVSLIAWRDPNTDPPENDFDQYIIVRMLDGESDFAPAGMVARYPDTYAAWADLPRPGGDLFDTDLTFAFNNADLGAAAGEFTPPDFVGAVVGRFRAAMRVAFQGVRGEP